MPSRFIRTKNINTITIIYQINQESPLIILQNHLANVPTGNGENPFAPNYYCLKFSSSQLMYTTDRQS